MSLTYFTKSIQTGTSTTTELWIADATGTASKVAGIGFYDGSIAAEPASVNVEQTAHAIGGGLYNAVTIGNTIYFTTYNSGTGFEIWKSDGTAAGTGPIGSPATNSIWNSPSQLTYFNGEIYFRATDGIHGYELWKTDGTPEGTVLVTDINAGPVVIGANTLAGAAETAPTGSSNPYSLVPYDGALYFSADDGVNGRQLWKTDGTAAGTVAVTAVPNGLFVDQIVVSNGKMFFPAYDSVNGWELYVSDGTAAGTTMLTNAMDSLGNAGASSYPFNLTKIDGVLYFSSHDPVTGASNLWRTDGTPSGTIPLTESSGYGFSDGITKAGGNLFFVRYDGATGLYSLWKTGGTAAGTTAVFEPDWGTNPYNLTAVNGTLYFAAYDGDHGYEIWTSDGTTEGTHRLTDLNIGPNGANPSSLQSVNGQLQFIAYDGTTYNLYAYDGTTTTLIASDVQDYATTSPITATNDLNGDATSDILWFNAALGSVNSFTLDNGAPTWAGYGAIDTAWTAEGTGDFNNDGTADILFRRGSDGAIGQFSTGPDGSSTWKGMGIVDSTWAVAGIADVNGDGTDDILYTSPSGALGYLKINNGAGAWHGLGFVDPSWHAAGAGDINGDGTADLLYLNESNHSLNALTFATGTLTAHWSPTIALLDANTHVAGLGDFNGDGTADILLYNGANNGALSYLEMHNGTGTLKSFTGITAIGSAWTVAGIGDYNNDGISDIAFYNDTLDAIGLLTINSTGGPAWTGLGAVDGNWKVV